MAFLPGSITVGMLLLGGLAGVTGGYHLTKLVRGRGYVTRIDIRHDGLRLRWAYRSRTQFVGIEANAKLTVVIDEHGVARWYHGSRANPFLAFGLSPHRDAPRPDVAPTVVCGAKIMGWSNGYERTNTREGVTTLMFAVAKPGSDGLDSSGREEVPSVGDQSVAHEAPRRAVASVNNIAHRSWRFFRVRRVGRMGLRVSSLYAVDTASNASSRKFFAEAGRFRYRYSFMMTEAKADWVRELVVRERHASVGRYSDALTPYVDLELITGGGVGYVLLSAGVPTGGHADRWAAELFAEARLLADALTALVKRSDDDR